MEKIYYIKNSVDECRSEITGYFSTPENAKEALKKCSDWYRPKGTGEIYSIENAKPKLEYKV